mmetsp:Transcript_73405/g.153212  ORF Transcript_73405/g.153212 Transcript_73405/m.153212 type:complete len:304 (+) Transcript_73405:58-969(+)
MPQCSALHRCPHSRFLRSSRILRRSMEERLEPCTPLEVLKHHEANGIVGDDLKRVGRHAFVQPKRTLLRYDGLHRVQCVVVVLALKLHPPPDGVEGIASSLCDNPSPSTHQQAANRPLLHTVGECIGLDRVIAREVHRNEWAKRSKSGPEALVESGNLAFPPEGGKRVHNSFQLWLHSESRPDDVKRMRDEGGAHASCRAAHKSLRHGGRALSKVVAYKRLAMVEGDELRRRVRDHADAVRAISAPVGPEPVLLVHSNKRLPETLVFVLCSAGRNALCLHQNLHTIERGSDGPRTPSCNPASQ